MKNYFFILLVIPSLISYGQTKLISHKSHSGTNNNFSLTSDGNLGIAPIIVTLDETKDSAQISHLTNDEMQGKSKGNGMPRYTRIHTKEGETLYSKDEFVEYKKFRNKYGNLKDTLSPDNKEKFSTEWWKRRTSYIDSISKRYQDSLEAVNKKKNILSVYSETPKPPQDQTPLLIIILSFVVSILGFLIWKIETRYQKSIL